MKTFIAYTLIGIGMALILKRTKVRRVWHDHLGCDTLLVATWPLWVLYTIWYYLLRRKV